MMTPQEAGRILKMVDGSPPGNPEDWSDLIPLKLRYSEELVFGEYPGVQWRAYQAASGNPNQITCSNESSTFMKDPCVRGYIRHLKEQRKAQRLAEYAGEEMPWSEVAELGKKVLVDVILGLPVTGKQLEAAIYAINRHEGLPTATLDLNVQNHERIAGATKMFTTRMAAQRKRTA